VTAAGDLVTYGWTHFEKNVTITAGGTFADINNGWVTIDGNLSITDPAANSGNGFWGDQNGSSSLVKGNLSYTITPEAAAAYPQYQWPTASRPHPPERDVVWRETNISPAAVADGRRPTTL
jgi:hypothetical protein